MKYYFALVLAGMLLSATACTNETGTDTTAETVKSEAPQENPDLQESVMAPATSTILSPADFSARMNEMGATQLVDVRTPGEFSSGHLAGATNIDWNGNDFDAGISTLDKSKPVFVYCAAGSRSAAASEKMIAEGFRVFELEGGISNWKSAGMQVVTE